MSGCFTYLASIRGLQTRPSREEGNFFAVPGLGARDVPGGRYGVPECCPVLSVQGRCGERSRKNFIKMCAARGRHTSQASPAAMACAARGAVVPLGSALPMREGRDARCCWFLRRISPGGSRCSGPDRPDPARCGARRNRPPSADGARPRPGGNRVPWR